LQEYKDGKLMHTYPLKALKLAAISAALNEGQERQAARASSSGKAAAALACVVTPLGEVVFKGHSAYDLAAQLQLGIRWVIAWGTLRDYCSSWSSYRMQVCGGFVGVHDVFMVVSDIACMTWTRVSVQLHRQHCSLMFT
jgi:hypothetical protein